jgi:hypothetical protein
MVIFLIVQGCNTVKISFFPFNSLFWFVFIKQTKKTEILVFFFDTEFKYTI